MHDAVFSNITLSCGSYIAALASLNEGASKLERIVLKNVNVTGGTQGCNNSLVIGYDCAYANLTMNHIYAQGTLTVFDRGCGGLVGAADNTAALSITNAADTGKAVINVIFVFFRYCHKTALRSR